MGILNVTPDSFSDGGLYTEADTAVAHALAMVKQGATVIDVGAESTRPGSEPVSAERQIQRAVPVIQRIVEEASVAVSMDTCDPKVAKAAIGAGASVINDITALGSDGMAECVAESGVPIVLMHMQGSPGTMQIAPEYQDVVAEVLAFLLHRAHQAEQVGVARSDIWIDPGIGFGKTLAHNLALLRHIDRFVETGYPVLVGASRKRMLADLTGRADPKDRIYGTNATVAHCVSKGVSCVRVHDVAPAIDTIKIIEAINQQPITV
ncbi:MAG: dihydropteroate synthase [Phycisphaeraceae bacterium]|nr:dihydropteroate synthase [Phycisphaeraceae bacterium]